MITPKKQAKVIFQAPKKYLKQDPAKTKFSLHRIFSLHLILGIFIILLVSIIYFPTPNKSLQTAEPATSTQDVHIFTPSLLPTEIPITPSVMPLDAIPELEAFTPIASPTATVEQEDFCLNVPIILYHHVAPLSVAKLLGHAQLTVDSGIFEEQMKYLSEQGYNALTSDDLINALLNRQAVPEKSIVITIDDGYDDNYTYAYLYAKKYQLVMNFMIPTQLIGKPGYMNWDHLREMRDNQYAAIYNHTANHTALGYSTNQLIESELATSSADFQRELGFAPNIFTYPYGSYSPAAVELLKQQGFIGAFTTDDGREQCLSNIMLLKRSHIGNAPMSSYGF